VTPLRMDWVVVVVVGVDSVTPDRMDWVVVVGVADRVTPDRMDWEVVVVDVQPFEDLVLWELEVEGVHTGVVDLEVVDLEVVQAELVVWTGVVDAGGAGISTVTVAVTVTGT